MKVSKQYHFFKNISFYYNIVRYNILFFILINILVSLLDGIGITLFIPIITNFGALNKINEQAASTNLLVNYLNKLGIPTNLYTLLAIVMIIFLIKGIIRGIQVLYLAKIRYNIITKIRLNLLNSLKDITFQGYAKQDIGQLMNNFTNEVSKIYGNMTNLFFIIQSALMASTYIILATLINWKFAIVSIIISIFFKLSFQKINKKTKTISKSITKSANKINKQFLQLITNFKYLKATNLLNPFASNTKQTIIGMESSNFQMGKLQSIIEALKEPLAVAVIIMLLAFQFKTGNTNLETIFISLILIYKAILNINILNSYAQLYNQTIGSIDAIKRADLDLKKLKENNNGTKYLNIIQSLKLNNISIAYSQKIILNNINLTINKNEIIAIVGESGSGKTSLINHLMGLQQPFKGIFTINDIDYMEYKSGELNSKIGYVSQDVVIFNDTIYNNITLFSEPTLKNRQKFWEVVKLTSLEALLRNSNLQENTKLGDNGVLISGGQKQRIAIARELFKEPQLLIMDEATSALDYETENTIRENLNQLKGKCTIILIAHRLSTLKKVDKIYLLNNKTIEAHGNYELLLHTSEHFNKMINMI